MHKARITALAAGAGLLAAAAFAAAPAVTAAPARTAAAAPSAGHDDVLPWLVVKPGVVRMAMTNRLGPFGTKQCEANIGIACYQPGQLRQAYHLGTLYTRGITGKGRTIAIVDSFGSPTIANDLKVFDKTFNIPAPPSFRIVTPAGKIPRFDPNNGDMTGWADETTLDVEWAHALAPGANILLVETPVSETEGTHGFPQIVTAEKWVLNHNLAAVISQSFSATEQTFTNFAQLSKLRGAYFLAKQDNVTVLAASGDSGAADVGLDLSTYYTFPVTSWPDSDPLVTGVGGTRLVQKTSSAFTSVAWNDTFNAPTNTYFTGSAGPSPFASGGGKSKFFTRPTWQSRTAVKSLVGARRGVPDISMSGACDGAVNVYGTADPNLSGWGLICGTSEATPEFAAIVAIADQVAKKRLGWINPTLYRLSAQKAPGIVDVTSGNNTVSFTQGSPPTLHTVKGFKAIPGYDLITGVGTVDASKFVYELAGVPIP